MRCAALALPLLLGAAAVQAATISVASCSSGGAWAGNVWTPSGPGSVVAASEVSTRLAASGAHVTIHTAAADIALTVRAALTVPAGRHLQLVAHKDIAIQAPVQAAGAAVTVHLGQGVPPPGDVLEHHTAGFAKTLCSAVFITGLDPDVAAESVGYFTGSYEQRKRVARPVVDRERKEVRIAIPGGTTVVARHYGWQGCVALPPGQDNVFLTPRAVRSTLPDAAALPWPMGDLLPTEAPFGYDTGRAAQAVEAAFSLGRFRLDQALLPGLDVVRQRGWQSHGPNVIPALRLSSQLPYLVGTFHPFWP